jgi:hypothetical protein
MDMLDTLVETLLQVAEARVVEARAAEASQVDLL